MTQVAAVRHGMVVHDEPLHVAQCLTSGGQVPCQQILLAQRAAGQGGNVFTDWGAIVRLWRACSARTVKRDVVGVP